jgi:UDP-galactopyranose mutase
MYLIVGCGLSGLVIAERIASILKKPVIIIEKRDHIAGNCYDFIDKETGILMNKYGAHLFHTNNKKVWDYINKFDKWERWEHKVLSFVDNKFVPMPVNITTVNMLCDENIENTEEMNKWLKKNQIEYDNIDNSEKMAKSRIGEKLYNKLVKNYTYKQWHKYPEDLNPSVLARIPIRNNFDCRYFSDKYQALPLKGYTHFCNNILKSNPLIKCFLNCDFFKFKEKHDITEFEGIIYTGPIDKYFNDHNLEKLEYRSIKFKKRVFRNKGYILPNSVVNYPEKKYASTRSVEYKHFLNQDSKNSVVVSETTTDFGEPYYPVPNEKNLNLYDKYKLLAEEEEKNNNVYFVGRLANYKYFNMDQAIDNALNFFDKKLNN